MQRQITQIKQIQIGKEFRIRTPNARIAKVRSDFQGTPLYIRCTSGTGIVEPRIIPVFEDGYAEIHFQEHYLLNKTYTFIITEQDKFVKEYTKPPVDKSVSGLQFFRGEVAKSQESLNQKFSGVFYSFDQSYFTRTIGQIVIQHKLDTDRATGFSGSGFGGLQALSCAAGYSAEELNNFYLSELLSIVRKGILKKSWQGLTGVVLNHNHDRYKSKPFEKALKGYFRAKDVNGKRTGRDLTVKDCKKEIYIPVWDISRMTAVITKTSCPDMPLWMAACSTIIDPLFFEASKSLVKEWNCILSGDVVKNNDVYLKKYNPSLEVISVGSPVRVWDKGKLHIDDRSKLIKLVEIKHDTDLDWSRSCGSKRYECKPVDELTQFDYSDKAISTAQKSGDINV